MSALQQNCAVQTIINEVRDPFIFCPRSGIEERGLGELGPAS